MEKGADLIAMRSELPKTERELNKAVQAILDGFASSALKTRMEQLEARKAEIEARLADASSPPPLLHPNMAELYRQKIGALHDNLQNKATGTQAREAIRSLITRIRLIRRLQQTHVCFGLNQSAISRLHFCIGLGFGFGFGFICRGYDCGGLRPPPS
ncbi:hypothetical protein [Acetobacter sp. KSO5]|uniref:hypothetical protein n=1 Tax=Acetobacter sp. KSO5 TaxID=3373674 RepID=UPI00376EB7D2